MKTFKRPMFRRGGSVNTGITSGMETNRTNFQGGTTEQMIKDRAKLYRQYAGDPIANLLIQGGLGLVSGEGAGKGTLGAVATAFQKPTQQALAQEQQIGLKAVGDVLSEQTAKELALIRAAARGDQIALQKLVNYSIQMGEFPNTEEGRKQAFEKYSKSASDISRASTEQKLYSASKAYREEGYTKSEADSLAIYDIHIKDKIPKFKRGEPFKSNTKFPKKPVPGKFYFDIDSESMYYYDGKFRPVTIEEISNILKSSNK